MVIQIEILYKDIIFGDFRASEYGLIVGSFAYTGNSEDNIGINTSTIEEFIGHNPIPIYLGQKYESKLSPQITLIKNTKNKDLYFHEKDCRWINRILVGKKGYQWMKLISYELDEDLWYRARINNISYRRIGGNITGIVLSMECDSCFAWSKENNITITAKANQHFYVYNDSDDLNNYVYPYSSIHSSSTGKLIITNISDNSWISEINNVKRNEKITIDSQHQIIFSNLTHDLLLNDFNLGWIRLVPGKNEYVSNQNITFTLKFRAPRKAGIVE